MPGYDPDRHQESVIADRAKPNVIVAAPVPANLCGWFTHHLTVVLMQYLLPATPIVDYAVPREQLVEQAVWFALRGMGLKDEVIRRLYNPKALALLTG